MIFVLIGIASAIIILADLYLKGNRQPMKIMNLVWVLTALWGGILALLAYYSFGRTKKKTTPINMPTSDMAMGEGMDMKMGMGMGMGMKMDMPHNSRPKWESTTLSTLHCGAGCTLADLIGDGLIILLPMAILSGWLLQYVLALAIGLMFQYVVMRAMDRKISSAAILTKAIKADFWSLTAWQIGMYGFFAVAIWGFGVEIDRLGWQFWAMMQVAMVCGFVVAYPVNRLLIKKGIKHAM